VNNKQLKMNNKTFTYDDVDTVLCKKNLCSRCKLYKYIIKKGVSAIIKEHHSFCPINRGFDEHKDKLLHMNNRCLKDVKFKQRDFDYLIKLLLEDKLMNG